MAHCLLEPRFYGNEDSSVVSCERAWGGVMSTAQRPLQLPALGYSRRASPAPGPWPLSQGREAPSQALGDQSNQVYVV